MESAYSSIFLALLLVASASRPAAAQSGKQQAEALRVEAENLRAAGDLAGSAAKLREALVASSEARLYFDLCLVLEDAGEFRQARSACRAVSSADDSTPKLDKDSREAFERIGRKMRGEQTPAPDPTPVPPPDPTPDPSVPVQQPPDSQPQPPPRPVTRPPVAPVPVSPPPPRIRGGVKLGLGVTNTTFDNSDPKAGFAIGGFLLYPVGNKFGFVAEGLIATKGASAPDGSLNLRYLEIPLLAQLRVGEGSLQPFVLAGGALSFLLSASAEVAGQPSFDVSEFTTGIDFGLVVGGGVQLPMGANMITLDGRANIGLVNINEDSSPGSDSGTNIAVTFLAGYVF